MCFYIKFGLDWVGNIPKYVYKLLLYVGCSRRVFFFWKLHISIILDMTHPQKMTFKLFLSVGCSRRGLFFWKMTHFHIFWHDNFPKSVFLIKNSIFGVIICQNIDIFAHILGPLTFGPFIKTEKTSLNMFTYVSICAHNLI